MWRRDPARGDALTFACAGLAVDLSKQPVDAQAIAGLCALARERGLPAAIEDLFAGKHVNRSEDRAALHMALRGDERAEVDGTDVRPGLQSERERLRVFAEAVRDGRWKGATGAAVRHVVALGIGGSEAGPRLVVEALGAAGGPEVRFVANVDPAALDDALRGCDPAATLFLVVSKTFTTEETMANAAAARAWSEEHIGREALARHFVAATASPAMAARWGLPECNVFAFPEWVGGRFSLWSSVGLPIAISAGMGEFGRLLAGAHAVDLEFRSNPLERNVPALMALVGIWNRNALGAASHVVLPYASRLQSLPQYLQQLEMESNGKRVGAAGEPLDFATAPALWGGAGTPGQHAFHQWLHQGTDAFACDFIVVARPMGEDRERHARLLAHACAQSEALMEGIAAPEPHRACPGARACTTVVMPSLDAYHLGSLIALYEHKVFAQAAVWGINPFDQWGVELGKKIAGRILPALQGGTAELEPATRHILGVIGKLAQPD
jgi:glucose-6-phosphate isomerase